MSWLPIETAPKDGTHIIAWIEGDFPTVVEWRKWGADYYWVPCEKVVSDAYGPCDPAYWMPIPPTPQENEEKMNQRKTDLEKDPIALYIARTDVVESFRCEYGGSGMLFGELPDYAVKADALLLFLTKNIGLAHDAIKLHELM